MSGVKVSWGQSVFGVKMSFFGSGSKCLWGQSVSGVKMSSGSKFLGVKVSLGSKCRWGQSVFGVKMGVSLLCYIDKEFYFEYLLNTALFILFIALNY